jgi:alpha-glucosidase (family GH31 glycosyl hydrolase)
VFPILIEAAHNTVLTGEPIIRPMWWNDSNDETNLIIDDQFLLSDKLLVAPILGNIFNN